MLDMFKKATASFLAAIIMVAVVFVPSVEARACSSGFLTLPAWYSNVSNDCRSVIIDNLNDIWVIALNIVEMLLHIVGYAAVGFIMWGGFRYMKSRGDPSSTQLAKQTILNAVLGLGVALGSTAIVSLFATSIAGGNTGFGLPNVAANQGQLANILNRIIFPIAGVVAVIFVIIGGIMFTISEGDPGKVKNARNTIIYSIVGLIFIIMAFAVVQLILGRFAG